MAGRSKKPATYEDIVKLPEHLVGEILEGELIVTPRPAAPHSLASSIIGGDLRPFHKKPGGKAPGGWIILDEPELHFRRDVVVPDLAGWRRERMPAVPRAAFIDLAPDWVCEVLSDRTKRHDRTKKTRIYAKNGVTHLWFVDPIARTLEVYARPVKRWELIEAYDEAVKVRAEPFEAIEIDLAEWWADLEPEPATP